VEEHGREFESFPEILVVLTQEFRVDHIWVITGPGSFTRLRIITLAVNSIKYAFPKIRLYGWGFFDLARTIWAKEPYIITANRYEFLVYENWQASFIKKEHLPEGTYFWYGEKTDFTGSHISIEYSYTWAEIIRLFSKSIDTERLSPIYIKEPHITWPKILPSYGQAKA
jgi:tRNA A37 threonylcarbamoyladenosine modification protein TsaB